MPQFDKITFFNQILWFLVAFFGFYFLLLKFLLPVLAASLKTRKKIIQTILSAGSLFSESSSRKSYVKSLQKFLKTHKLLFANLSEKKLGLSEKSKAKILKQSLLGF